MDKDIASNLHTLLKEFYQVSGKEFNGEKATELGVNLAKEITKLPAKDHLLAWNIIGESVEFQFANETGRELASNTGKAIAAGAITILNTSDNRDTIIRGITQYETDQNFVRTLNIPKQAKVGPKFPFGFDMDIIEIDKNFIGTI